MTPNLRNYRATFILDNRGKEDSIEQMIGEVKNEITGLQGEISQVNDLGKRDFARVTDRKMTGGFYVQIDFRAPAGVTTQLHDRLRLNHNVYRTFVQSV